jgi:hypothetical protein
LMVIPSRIARSIDSADWQSWWRRDRGLRQLPTALVRK